MWGVIYLAVATLVGTWLVYLLVCGQSKEEGKKQPLLLLTSAGFGTGILLLTWAVYLFAWFFATHTKISDPLFAADFLVLSISLIVAGTAVAVRLVQKKPVLDFTGIRKPSIKEGILVLLLAGFAAFCFFYVFHIGKDHRLYSGYTVFSDYAPHTAMIRSFSHENNYPTQYPHFGGEDVRYHFMFQFLAGNLEHLGLPIDWAYNLPSILSLAGFWVVLGEIGAKLGSGFWARVWTVIFFLFRSGTTFFRFAAEHLRAGDLWETLRENTVFLGYTQNENWGLWNFNVYLNQRHLAFGLLITAFVIWMYLDSLMKIDEIRGRGTIVKCLFAPSSWKCIFPEKALILGMMLGLLSIWNGACVIAALLILFGFAVFSAGKTDYLITAVTTILLSLCQTSVFIRGEAVSPSLYFGFIANDKSILGILIYLVCITGFFFLGAIVMLPLLSRWQRVCLGAFLLPVVFAFCASLTPDITVNQKYIMIAYAFTAVYWGWAMDQLTRFRWKGILVMIPLVICLTATGIYDYVVIIRDNDSGHRMSVPLNSSVTRWLNENLDHEDLVLTPMYSMNEVTLSGEMLYCGWPYYAWSAGYDTNRRGEKQNIMYTTDQPELLRSLCREEGITYIIYEEGMTLDGVPCREETIREAFPLVYEDENGYFRIYRVEG